MKIPRIMRRGIAVLLILVAQVIPALAQTDGRFTGAVLDPSGSGIPGATIVVKNEKTGEERTVTSNEQGRYLVPNLKPSIYTIKVTVQNFAPLLYNGLPLQVAQEFPLDLQVQAAGVTEAVTVTGETPSIDLSSARMGVNVSERDVAGLPVNGRQMSQLLLQAPGSLNSGTGTWQDIRFSGRAVEQNVIKYDGIEGSAIIDAAPGNVNGENNTPFKLQASLENVQEFRVESNSYPAEYGTGTGGQISVVTKSGSNGFRGSAFEFVRSDKLDARNYFDSQRNLDGSVLTQLPKSKLKQNQFGGSMGGPLAKDRAFFFGSYEGYRLDAGLNFIEGVPSDAAWAKAVPAIAPLRAGFLASGAVILPGASANTSFDIAQYQSTQVVREDSFSARVDYRMSSGWLSYVRLFRDTGKNDEPQGVTGRRFQTTSKPTNFVYNLQRVAGTSTNDAKFGYNAAQTTEVGVAGIPAFDGIAFNLSGSVANTGIAGQGATSGLASPGGLVRVNSAGNGRSAPYDPYSLTFADTFNKFSGNHLFKFGGDVRLIRMATDQQGGITYTFGSVDAFMANTPSGIQYFGDLSEPSPFHNGATGMKHPQQNYYVAFAQDEWKVSPKVTLNYGLRYDYYAPLHERDDRIVKFNIYTGQLDPDTTPFYKTKKTNFQPRVSSTWAMNDKTVLRGGVGIFVGPGQTEDQIQPIEAERISTSLSSGPLLLYPVDVAGIRSNFTSNPGNRAYQPRAYDNNYTLPEKVYQYTASLQRQLDRATTLTVAYVGSQGRNLFLRSISNRTVGLLQTNPTATASNIREFDVVTCADGRVLDGRTAPLTSTTVCAGSSPISKTSPFAEVDYKTSGGHDSYNALQIGVSRRAMKGVSLNGQYTYGASKGNTAGSNEATTVGNNARAIGDFDYDDGYNNFDVRQTYNVSALYNTPGNGAWTGNWQFGAILNGRSGVPIPVLIARNDIAYVDAAGNVFNNPAADRTAVINTPFGGTTRSTRRPDLVPGVDPFIQDGGLLFLNPAAFATPKPGTFGNLERNSIHGPAFRQMDLVISKKLPMGATRSLELRSEIFNIFNVTNFANPVGTLPNALPNAALTETGKVQPGVPYTAAAAGTFGRLTSTVGRTVGLGTPRQVQFALRFAF
jgi:Carboxypeptidase regulatory-like domain/TonB dependent receptor